MTNQNWLADAVVYQIYPQSFKDSNGDGIGDFRGVIQKLDYLETLGIDAIWFNPCFESPFVDAGYDVADYLKVAGRYGTNEDLIELIETAKSKGIRVLLDLVAGHTSIEHPWFQGEMNTFGPLPEGDRYVWCEELPAGWDSDLPGTPAWVKSPGKRKGWYLKNFYDEQPALNFGWIDPEYDWQNSPSDPGPQRNIQALKDIISFWLDRGVAGFRIDMAFSLIKGYDRPRAENSSASIWTQIREWLDLEHPGTVLIPEGSEPRTSQPLAFDADFFLVIFEAHASLFDNHHAGKLPFHSARNPFFDAAGKGTTEVFTKAWNQVKQQDSNRLVMLASADHDFNRLCCGERSAEQLPVAFAFLLTWGSVPSIWYGDEIGMRYLSGLPNREGAICNPDYNRAGCRTPMQWDSTANAGFSTAESDLLYLPIDPDVNRPSVESQLGEQDSVVNHVRRLIALRRATSELRAGASTEVLHADYPWVYRRGERHLVALNPKGEEVSYQSADLPGARMVLSHLAQLSGSELKLKPFGYAILELA